MSSQRFIPQKRQTADPSGFRAAALPAFAASLALLLSLPGQARAERERSYGSVAITVGTHGGQTTVSRTWGDAPRQEQESVICERGTVVEHRYSQPRPQVVVYHPAPRRVVIVDPPRRHGYYGHGRDHGRYVVERRHYDPRCDKRDGRRDGGDRHDSRRDRDDHNRHGRRG